MKNAYKSTYGKVLPCANRQDPASAIQNSEERKESSKLFPGG